MIVGQGQHVETEFLEIVEHHRVGNAHIGVFGRPTTMRALNRGLEVGERNVARLHDIHTSAECRVAIAANIALNQRLAHRYE